MSARYLSTKCKTSLSRSALPGLDYALNPYRGCEHGCLYCYSPAILRDRELTKCWGQQVWIKENVAEILASEVERLKPGVVGVSTVCDPYQPVERREELTRRCLETFARSQFSACIQTKSDLVLRDKDIISGQDFEVGVTLTTMDEELARKLEPRASPPSARVKVLEEFASQGVETWIFLGPVIPEVNDVEEQLRAVIDVARKTRSYVIYDKLNLKVGVLERLERVLCEDLISRLPELVTRGSDWWSETRRRIERICASSGVRCEPAFS